MKTLQLTNIELSTVEQALNHYWNFANNQMERDDLGDLETIVYRDILKFSNKMSEKLESI